MGLHETIAKTRKQHLVPFDWQAFRNGLPTATEGPPPVSRRRTVSLGDDLAMSVTLEERTILPSPEPDDFTTLVTFGATWAEIMCPWTFVQALVDAHEIDQPCDGLSVSALSLIAEHLLAGVVKPLETALGGECRIGPRDNLGEGGAFLCLSLELSSERFRISVRTEQSMAEQLLSLFPPASPVARLPLPAGIPMSLALRSPEFRMTAREFAALEAGDVVLLDQRWSPTEKANLVSDGSVLGQVQHDPKRKTTTFLQLASKPAPEGRDNMSTLTKRPSAPGARSTEASAQAALDNLTVNVSVELDRSEMQLGELRKLTAGTVLPFAGEVGDNLTILANGEPFATGELVRIGERTGVRLLSLE